MTRRNGTATAAKKPATPATNELLDYEALAANARQARAVECLAEVQPIMDRKRCEFAVEVILGKNEAGADIRVPIGSILALPVVVTVRPK